MILRWGRFSDLKTREGLYFSNPWGRKVIKVSTQDMSLEVPRATVVEANGNPIEISAIVVYRVSDTRKAALDVQDVGVFIRNQATSVIKRVASQFPYESSDPAVPCLRKESEDVSRTMVSTLSVAVHAAGVEILSVRLNDLTYAPEIAQAMLMRQQAQAMVEARKTIVDGAVGMVRDALERLADAKLAISPSRQEEIIASLLVVLCSTERVQPTIQVGRGAVLDDSTAPPAPHRGPVQGGIAEVLRR